MEKEPLYLTLFPPELCKIIELCEDRGALDIEAFDACGQSSIADYNVICSVHSSLHAQALLQHIRKGIKEYRSPKMIEGKSSNHWIILDYCDIVVHLFHDEFRSKYQLEEIFSQYSRQIYSRFFTPLRKVQQEEK